MRASASTTQALRQRSSSVLNRKLISIPPGANASTILKGVVIGAVLINHYFDHFTSVERSNIANTMVVVFFVLSGYGISASLQKKVGDRFSAARVLTFYQLRVARIFPLLWISLLLQSLIIDQPYSIYAFLGYGLTGHYWFISSILECYLLSPLLAWALNRQKHVAIAIMTFLLLATHALIGLNPELTPALMTFHLTTFPFLEIYFINIYLFFCGMYFQRIWQERHAMGVGLRSHPIHSLYAHRPATTYTIFWLLFAAALGYTVVDRLFFSALPFLGGVLLFSATAIYALCTRVYSQDWISKALLFTGQHSLAFYLLHIPFYFLIARMGLIQRDSYLSLLLCLILLPVFVWVALKIEQLGQVASDRLRSIATNSVQT